MRELASFAKEILKDLKVSSGIHAYLKQKSDNIDEAKLGQYKHRRRQFKVWSLEGSRNAALDVLTHVQEQHKLYQHYATLLKDKELARDSFQTIRGIIDDHKNWIAIKRERYLPL